MDATRERTLVGLFVLVAGALLLGTMIVVSGGLVGATVAHRAYFKFAGGVQPGAPVRYGGMIVGKVQRVLVDPANSTRIEIDLAVSRDAPIKKDSVAKITTLGPLTENYIEISTGSQQAGLAPADSELTAEEAFGLPQLGDAVQAMLPEIHKTIDKLDQNLDGLQVTLTRANDLLNDSNRAHVAGSLNNLDHMVAEVRPKANDALDHVNGLLTDATPKVNASLDNVQAATAKLTPMLDDLKKTVAQANDTLAHVDSTLMDNRPDIRTTVTGLRDAVAKSNTLIDDLNQSLNQNADNIDQVLENIRMTTENLRILTDNLMHSPSSIIFGTKVPDRKPGDVPK
jgi:phospholipid/cholesterol/gamma-HCH transport system substrate-binding protein